MNAIETNRYTDAWQTFGLGGPRPSAIVCVSAHWYIGATAVTAMAEPRTIHDFYGFPDDLFAVRYPAPGDPTLAADLVGELSEVVKPDGVVSDTEDWGLDHGTWSVLVHAFPEANIPVVQVSIDARRSFDQHLALGAALAPFRRRGVMVVGSGNVVHNLRRIDWGQPESAYDWTRRFDDATREVMATDPARAPSLREHPDFALAHPSPDHFIPLLYVAGLATAANQTAHVLVDGFAYGSLSMTSYTLGPTGPAPAL